MKRRAHLVVAAVALLGVASCGGDDAEQSVESVASSQPAGVPDGVEDFVGLARDHTTDPVAYPQTPPVGGAHNPEWQQCGYYDSAIQTEMGVHSMEHGAVWVTYAPDLPAEQVAIVKGLVDGRSHVLVSPFENLPKPVVASAWGEQLQLDSATDPRLAQFVEFFEQGPQTPEPGAPC